MTNDSVFYFDILRYYYSKFYAITAHKFYEA